MNIRLLLQVWFVVTVIDLGACISVLAHWWRFRGSRSSLTLRRLMGLFAGIAAFSLIFMAYMIFHDRVSIGFWVSLMIAGMIVRAYSKVRFCLHMLGIINGGKE